MSRFSSVGSASRILLRSSCQTAPRSAKGLSSAAAASSAHSTPKPKGYRLTTMAQLGPHLRPLQAAGWRLKDTPHREIDPHIGYTFLEQRDELRPGDLELQGKRLMRVYQFKLGTQGWRDLMYFMQVLSEEIEDLDHHPAITISPTQEYLSPLEDLPIDRLAGYVLELSTHTHSPSPPTKEYPKKKRARPGLTGKDLQLAEVAERLFEETTGDRRHA